MGFMSEPVGVLALYLIGDFKKKKKSYSDDDDLMARLQGHIFFVLNQ